MPISIRAARSSAQRSLVFLTAVMTCWAGTVSIASAEGVRSDQWYLDAMKADQIRSVANGNRVTVAVVDSGVDSSIPELRGRVLHGKDLGLHPTSANKDEDGHGTAMASLIAGTGAEGGIQGLAPGAKILPVKVGKVLVAADELMAMSIRYAVKSDAKVINISMGGAGDAASVPKTREAVKYALSKGKLIFASAGNDGDKGNYSAFPANISGVVGVAAVDSSGTVADFSTYGSQVALASPGKDIPSRSCEDNRDFCPMRGTSPASALASASAALIWSKHPSWTNNQVLRVMMQTANRPKGKIPSRYIGYGIIRPAQVLLDGKGKPGPADVNPLLKREGATTPDPSPSASKSGGTQPQPSDSNKQASDQQAGKETTADAKANESGNTGLWIALGAGAAVVIAAVAIVMVRRRGNQY